MASRILPVLFCLAAMHSIASAASPAEQRGQFFARANCARCHSIDKVTASPLKIAPPFRSLHKRYPIESIAEALADGDRVELRGFGTFEVRERDARSARNPRTGEKVAVEARAKVHFKPGKTMRARLNRAEVTVEQEAERSLRAS